jgi:hypothetical protein
MKNTQAKMRKIENPYEIWMSPVFGGCEYRVLKKWQADDNKPYARWMVAAKSEATFGGWDMGDEYVENIKAYGRKVYDETVDGPKTFPK